MTSDETAQRLKARPASWGSPSSASPRRPRPTGSPRYRGLARPRVRRRDGLSPRPGRRRGGTRASVLDRCAVGGDAGDGVLGRAGAVSDVETRSRPTDSDRSTPAGSPPTPPGPDYHRFIWDRINELADVADGGGARVPRARRRPTPPRCWSATSPAAPDWAGSARTRCSSTPSAAATSSSRRSSPTSNCRPTNPSQARTAAPAPPASTPAPRRRSPSRTSSTRRSASAT